MKIGRGVSELWRVENCPLPLTWPMAYTTACTTVQAVMFPQSNCPPTELMFSTVLVHQFGIASLEYLRLLTISLMFLACDIWRHSCLLIINSCNTVAWQVPCDCCIIQLLLLLLYITSKLTACRGHRWHRGLERTAAQPTFFVRCATTGYWTTHRAAGAPDEWPGSRAPQPSPNGCTAHTTAFNWLKPACQGQRYHSPDRKKSTTFPRLF